jgi:hypothetical protein
MQVWENMYKFYGNPKRKRAYERTSREGRWENNVKVCIKKQREFAG